MYPPPRGSFSHFVAQGSFFMANHCTTCGRELRDEERFCAACGAPVGLSATTSETTVPSQPTTYETCEIKWRPMRGIFTHRFVFYAEAIGPQGMYNAGESQPVKNMSSPVGGVMHANQQAAERAMPAFIAQLTSQGWESVPEQGLEWFSYRFRRPVRG